MTLQPSWRRAVSPIRAWLLALLLTLSLALPPLPAALPSQAEGPELQVFVRQGCPHCGEAKAFLPVLQRRRPELRMRLRSLDSDPAALDDLRRISAAAGIQTPGVPTFFLVERCWWASTGPGGGAGSCWP